jgi:hypothetical protein
MLMYMHAWNSFRPQMYEFLLDHKEIQILKSWNPENYNKYWRMGFKNYLKKIY